MRISAQSPYGHHRRGDEGRDDVVKASDVMVAVED
jgi:hypothetical protein